MPSARSIKGRASRSPCRYCDIDWRHPRGGGDSVQMASFPRAGIQRTRVIPAEVAIRVAHPTLRASAVEPCWCAHFHSCIAIVHSWRRSAAAWLVKALFMLNLPELKALARRLRAISDSFRWARGFDRRRHHRKLRPTRRSNIVARVIQDRTQRRLDSSAPKARTKRPQSHATNARTAPQTIGIHPGRHQALSRPVARAYRRAVDCVAALDRRLCGG
jgi:hypothetical protein